MRSMRRPALHLLAPLAILLLKAFSAVGQPVTDKTCTGSCAAKFEQCSGYKLTPKGNWQRFDRRCCAQDFRCISRDAKYAQCLHKDAKVADHWEKKILKCNVPADKPGMLPRLKTFNAVCGPNEGVCEGAYACCSSFNRCGDTPTYCKKGCRPLYGNCGDDYVRREDPSPPPPKLAPPPPAPVSGPGTTCTDPWIVAAIEENNKLRADVGEQPLVCVQKAVEVAYAWSQQMCKAGALSHDAFLDRCQELSFGWCGENVLYNYVVSGTEAPLRAITSWFNSPTHQANMLNERYQKVGYAYFTCPDTRVYWTGIYGA